MYNTEYWRTTVKAFHVPISRGDIINFKRIDVLFSFIYQSFIRKQRGRSLDGKIKVSVIRFSTNEKSNFILLILVHSE